MPLRLLCPAVPALLHKSGYGLACACWNGWQEDPTTYAGEDGLKRLALAFFVGFCSSFGFRGSDINSIGAWIQDAVAAITTAAAVAGRCTGDSQYLSIALTEKKLQIW